MRDDDDLRSMTFAEKVTVVVLLVPILALLVLAWYAFMYPVLFR